MRTELLIHPEELNEKWAERAIELRLDRLTLHPHGGRNAHISLAKLIDMLDTPEVRQLIDRLCDSGVEIGYEFHATSYLLGRELFASHPEYFRMNENGERTSERNTATPAPRHLK